MASPIAVNVGLNPAQLWSGRSTAGINTLLLMNTDQSNTVMVGTTLNSLVVPIQPNGSLSVDPSENWYVVGTVAGNAPLVVVPNGQSNFLGLSQGYGNIAIPQFQSPNYDPNTGEGWALFKDGTASFNEITIVIQASGVAVLIYFPTPGLGNLIGSWAASEFTDQYGNDIQAGLNANGGQLAAITLNAPSVIGGTIFQALLNASTITASNITGGTSYEQKITFDTGGGLLLGYSTTVTNVNQTVSGTYTQTLPPGVTTINNAFCWGAGAGGDGGLTSEGGNGGGGGELAGETSYTPTTNPFTYVVGNGGNSSTTGSGHGGDGGDSFIDGGGVLANGGNGNGTPGTGSTNTFHHDGGAGGASNGNSGGASGGNSGNTTSNGNAGSSPTGSAGAPSPAGQVGSGTGGSGGADGGNGNNGTSPGAGGGGAGQGSGTPATLTKTYEALYTASYYGPDAANPNKLRSTSTMYQGGETAGGGSFNGNQRCVMVFDSNQIASDFAGYTPVQCSLKLVNQHTWYNSGMTVEIDVGNAPTKYPTNGAPSTWLGQQNYFTEVSIGEGATKVYNLGSSVAGYFINNQTNFLGLGAYVAANHPYNLAYYGYFYGQHSVNVEITITGTKTISGSTTSGQGSDGEVSFSFATTQAMVFALSPQAGNDGNGNSFVPGYNGPTNAIQPGSNPAIPETWHPITLDPAWATVAGYSVPKYRILPDNNLQLAGIANIGSVKTGTDPLNANNPLPVGYRPANQKEYRIGNGDRATVQIDNTGVIHATDNGSSWQYCEIDGVISLL